MAAFDEAHAPARVSLAFVLTAAIAGCGGGGDSFSGELLGSDEAASVVCDSGTTLEGIDVSYYQGDIDWTAVAASGRAFAITRINDGHFMDPKFDENWAAIRDAGMVRGAYQFFEPGLDPSWQADVVIQAVGMLGPGDLPVTADMEVTGGASGSEINDAMHVWFDKVTAGTGRRPIVYTGKYFWNDNVGTGDFADYPLWIAQYGPACPDLPTAWGGWAMWQYTSTGSIPGIGGNVDHNVFNGTMEALNELAGNNYKAEVVSFTYPESVRAGETATATLVLKNAGGRGWDESTHLGTTEPRDRESPFAGAEWLGPNRPVGVGGAVPPGAEQTLTFTLHAPHETGTFTEHFNLVEEQVAWFSDGGQGGPSDDQIALTITVTPPVDEPPLSGSSAGVGGGGPEDGEGGEGPLGEANQALHGSCAVGASGGSGAVWVLALLLAGGLERRRRRR